MPEFVHLHVHSHYSLLDGLGKIPDIIDRVGELGMRAVALTDHGALYGLVKFWQQAKKHHIHPILGVEAYLVADRTRFRESAGQEKIIRHLTLLAENRAGYQNLLKLITDAHLNGFYRKPCIDYPTLQQHREGLIVLSGCVNGDLPQAILRGDRATVDRLIAWHLEVFGREHFFLELQHHPSFAAQGTVNTALRELARTHGIGLVATGDVHYVRREDAEAQDVLLCVQTGTRVTEKDRLSMLGEDFSLQTPEYFADAFRDVPEALENTVRIAERCQLELPLGKYVLPPFPVPAGDTPERMLRRFTEEGLTTHFGETISPAVRERLDYELSVIEKTGFVGYLLIVRDFMTWARARGILATPRGSAAGSLVSYLIGISQVDPLQYRLAFERFLNLERIAMPDIDVDFADDRRDEVIAYVREKYGSDHVAQIITFGTMAARAAVRDAGRALGYPYVFCDKVAKLIPFGTSLNDAQKQSPDLQRLAAADPQVQRLLDTARKLEGVARNAGTHAAGVVITPTPLVEHVPLQHASQDDTTIITQYNMHDIEDLGLLKMDFLGLRNLTVLQHCVRIVQERYGEEIALGALPLEDAPTYKTLQDGLTTGVFQLESSGMKRYLKELKPTELEDIVAMVSLYRPGPMELIPDYIAGKHGLKQPAYLHPALQPILEKTYGIAVYQEQILEIARDLAGFTMGQADVLRKAIGKKIGALLKEQREKFVAGAKAKGVPLRIAEKVFDFIEPFAGYSFNRAHAVCYALIAYQTAYLKTHFPAAFMAALLASDEDDIDRVAIEVAEATAMGIPVLPPDVNESGPHFTVVDTPTPTPTSGGRPPEAIRFGLLAVKNVGKGVVAAILEARAAGGAFTDIAEFFQRVRTRDFNKKAAESLAKAGALDALAERNLILENLDTLLQLNRTTQRQATTGQGGLFSAAGGSHVPAVRLKPVPAAAHAQRLRWEKELLGLYVSGHPLQDLGHLLAGRVTPIKDVSGDLVDYSVRVGGVLTRIQRVRTRSQDTMVFATLEDQTGSIEVLVFPTVLNGDPELWAEEQLLLVEGRISDRDGETKIVCERVERVVTEPAQEPTTMILPDALPRPSVLLLMRGADRDTLLKLKSILSVLPPGPARVYLRVPKKNGAVDTVRTSFQVTLHADAQRQLVDLLGSDAVHVTLTEEADVPAVTLAAP